MSALFYVQCTLRFGSTAKVLLKCKLKYYRISECSVPAQARLAAYQQIIGESQQRMMLVMHEPPQEPATGFRPPSCNHRMYSKHANTCASHCLKLLTGLHRPANQSNLKEGCTEHDHRHVTLDITLHFAVRGFLKHYHAGPQTCASMPESKSGGPDPARHTGSIYIGEK